jgi:hypothetical protein
MIFNVVSPIIATIDGDSLKEAVKNFIKINHSLNITNMIIKDQSNNIEGCHSLLKKKHFKYLI